jgi:hypothetical protein
MALYRILLAYLLVPLVPPVGMLSLARAWRMSFGDWLGILLLYQVFGLIALIVLGTPLLLIYKRLGWTGWGAFMLGGGACAALTSGIMLSGARNRSLIALLTTLGMVAGLVFRVVLYGPNRIPPSNSPAR